ncbi:hypothetical protein BDL97_11G053600 [Sphagnum fallax]|nr:hypothetical protein BDL97_11G053600 [Sphagnum fallax]
MSGKDVRVWRTRGKDAALKQTKKRRLRRPFHMTEQDLMCKNEEQHGAMIELQQL